MCSPSLTSLLVLTGRNRQCTLDADTGNNIDLANPEHRCSLLKWLSDWRCRHLSEGQHRIASHSVLNWYQRDGASLFANKKPIWDLETHLLGNTKMDGISLNKVDKMAGLSFENGLRLHFDSILLFKNKSYPSAYFLSVLAIEEIGKAFLIMDFLWRSRVDGRMEREWEEKFLEDTYFHTAKQSSFAYNFDSPISTNRFFKSLYKGELEILKQNSVYVGLARNKRKINLKSRINNPLKIDKMKAQKQITNVNDCLLDLTLGVMKQVYCVDSDCVENLLNKRLLSKLKGKWSLIGGKTKTRLKKLERIKIDKVCALS